jgi:hypothetical protein
VRKPALLIEQPPSAAETFSSAEEAPLDSPPVYYDDHSPGRPALSPVLMGLGTTSAYDIMAYSEDVFTTLYSRKYFEIYNTAPPQTESRLVYRKAKQVSSVTYNLFAIAKKMVATG